MPTDYYDVARAYNVIYSTKEYHNNKSYYLLALETLHPKAGNRLLDIACGLGDLLYLASQRHIDCYGIDISEVAVQAAQANVPEANISQGSGEALAFPDETFDYVTLIGSLEHLLDPGKGLLEIRRVLKWKGQALILVPNAYYLPDLVWNVGRHGRGPDHKQVVERFAAVNDWRAFIESGGLMVQRVTRFNFQWPSEKGDWAWYKQNPHRILKLLAAPFIPFNFSHSFLYLCTKEPISAGQKFNPPYWPSPPRLVDLGL